MLFCVHALSGRNLLSVHNPRTCLASHYDGSSCLALLLTATPCWSSSLLVFLSFLFLSHLVFSLACQQFLVVFTPLSYSLTTSDSLKFLQYFFLPFSLPLCVFCPFSQILSSGFHDMFNLLSSPGDVTANMRKIRLLSSILHYVLWSSLLPSL